jgi:hypothetical protein
MARTYRAKLNAFGSILKAMRYPLGLTQNTEIFGNAIVELTESQAEKVKQAGIHLNRAYTILLEVFEEKFPGEPL